MKKLNRHLNLPKTKVIRPGLSGHNIKMKCIECSHILVNNNTYTGNPLMFCQREDCKRYGLITIVGTQE